MSKKVKETAIGIDLGTTYSCAAIWIGRNNRVEIIPNEQGSRITPSCVAFSNSELLVGESAKNQIARNPTNTVFDVKRLTGSRFRDHQVQKDMELWPFKVMEGDSEKPRARLVRGDFLVSDTYGDYKTVEELWDGEI